MAYPRNFLRLVCSGTLYGGAERFSFGMSFAPDFEDGGGAVVAGPPITDAVVAAITSYFKTTTLIGGHAAITLLKMNMIGADGKYLDPVGSVYRDVAPITGVANGTNPAQIALAVTLRTGKRRGLANSGRFYLPGPAGTVAAADGLLPIVYAQAAANATATMLNAVSSALPGPSWGPVVASNVREGAIEPVLKVEVGRVYDTIRARRSDLAESYVASTVALAA